MSQLADLVEQHADELAELESLDNGKPVKLARIVDVSQTIGWFRHLAGWAERIQGEVFPVRQPDMHVTRARSRSVSAAKSSHGTSRC